MAVRWGWTVIGTVVALGACTVAQGPLMVLPGPGKDAESFRQDYAACRQPVGAPGVNAPAPQSSPGAAPAPAAGDPGQNIAGAPPDAAAWQAAEAAFVQCMVGRGNAVQPAPMPYAGSAYAGAPYAGGFPYDYAPPAYPFMGYPYGDAGYAGTPYWSGYYGSAWLGFPVIAGGIWGGYWGGGSGGGWRGWHGGHGGGPGGGPPGGGPPGGGPPGGGPPGGGPPGGGPPGGGGRR